MTITRSQLIRRARHNIVDYTQNFFTEEIVNDKFDKVMDELLRRLDFPQLRSYWGVFGKSSTIITITNPSGTTFRYTYVSGYAPLFVTNLLTTSHSVVINVPSFSSVNNGTFVVTAVTETYFEITNASGVVESNKAIGKGYIVNSLIRGVSNQSDYEKPSNFMKFGGVIKVGSNFGTKEYYPILEEESPIENNYSRHSVWIEDDRFVFSPLPGLNQNIIIPYYKTHPTITDNLALSVPDDAEDALVQMLIYEFMVMDDSVASQEVELQRQKAEASKIELKRFLLHGRLKWRRHQFNKTPDDTFYI